MKIPGSVRYLFDTKSELYDQLKKAVDDKIKVQIDPKWHYESRVKCLQSFSLKIETGRCEDLQRIEDFFACTIVVQNQNEIPNAINFIKECNFVIKDQRPHNDTWTHKNPNSFPFDDLRLYVEWQDHPTLKPTPFNELLFEIQLKTYLQHAWSIATHDLVYKTDSISWPKQRIAYQIKAMLEHAEVAISQAEALSNSKYINKNNNYTRDVTALIELFQTFWNETQLPDDLTRLADTVLSLLMAIGIKISTLKIILTEETRERRGAELLNLSPYGIIVQSIFKKEEKKVKNYMDCENNRFKIFTTREMDLPEYISSSNTKKLISLE